MTYPQALKALSQGKFAPSIAALLGHLAYNPEDARAWMHLGIAYTESGHHESATAALHKAEDLGEKSAELREALGCAYLRQGKKDAAEWYLVEAVESDVPPPSALRNLGILRLKMGRLEEAHELVSQALSRSPDDAQSLYARVLTLEQLYRSHRSIASQTELFGAIGDLLERPGLPQEIRRGATYCLSLCR